MVPDSISLIFEVMNYRDAWGVRKALADQD